MNADSLLEKLAANEVEQLSNDAVINDLRMGTIQVAPLKTEDQAPTENSLFQRLASEINSNADVNVNYGAPVQAAQGNSFNIDYDNAPKLG